MVFRSVITCGAAGALALAVIIGLLLSGVPRQLGLFTLLPPLLENSRQYGMLPPFIDGVAWGYTWDEFAEVDLTGQTALVTGANAGIGFALSNHLAKRGATVYMACRNDAKCEAARKKIISFHALGVEVHTVALDTSKLSSVRACAKDLLGKISVLDMLFLNAGTGAHWLNEDGSLGLTEDGIEHVFATNHVGHHCLYRHLAAAVAAAPVGRIVLTSSAGHFGSFDYGVALSLEQLNGADPGPIRSLRPYCQSKLAQVLWAQELTRRLGAGSNIFVNSFHPGAVATEIWGKAAILPRFVRNFIESVMDSVMWSSDDGALTGLYLGVHVGLSDKSVRGEYFHPQSHKIAPNPKHATNASLQARFWQFSDQLTDAFAPS